MYSRLLVVDYFEMLVNYLNISEEANFFWIYKEY